MHGASVGIGRPKHLAARDGRPTRAGVVLGLALIGVLGLVSCGKHGSSVTSPSLEEPGRTVAPKVAIISIDGLRADALQAADAPTIQGLAAAGAYARAAKTVVPSITIVAHPSMLSGYDPERHGITRDDGRTDRPPLAVPTVFSVARAAGRRTAMVLGKSKLAFLADPSTVNTYVLASRGDDDVASQAAALAGGGYDLMFVHFPDTDLAGHTAGWMSARYMSQITQTDRAVAGLLAALPPETVVILTADHGGHGTTHGQTDSTDMTIPWIIVGPGIRAGFEITTAVRVTDTAATAAYVLGLQLPSDVAGRPVLSAFVSPR